MEIGAGPGLDDGSIARDVLVEISQMHVALDSSGSRIPGRALRAADRFCIERLAALVTIEVAGLDGTARATARREQVSHVLAIFRAYAALCKVDDDHGRKAATHWGPGMFQTRPSGANTLSAWDMVVRDVSAHQERQAVAAASGQRAEAEAAAEAETRRGGLSTAESRMQPRPAPRAVAYALPSDLAAALQRLAPDAARSCAVIRA